MSKKDKDDVLKFMKENPDFDPTARGSKNAAVSSIADPGAELLWKQIGDKVDRVHESMSGLAPKAPAPAAAATSVTEAGGTPSSGVQGKKKKNKPRVLNGHFFPQLPCTPTKQDPREKNPRSKWLVPAMVARPVSKAEIARNPTLKTGSCSEALNKEWRRLREKRVWD